ncbi:putative domain XH, zinc finger-XS domain protein [Tanacetum coccineum]
MISCTLARDEDYDFTGLVGAHLRNNKDLKTVADIEKEDEVKTTKLILWGMELMQEKTTKQLENIFIEHEKRKRQLEDREKELRAREAVNDTEKRKLGSEKKKVLQCCVTSDIYAFKKI